MGALLRIPLDVVQERMMSALHASGFDDLVVAHLAVLRYPGPDGRRPIELASQANMSKQALNYLLGQLEERGYLVRRPDPEDPRSKRVYVTERGDATRSIMRNAVREVEDEWAAALGAEDLERLREMLTRLTEVVRAGASQRGEAGTSRPRP
jgi:DNA-binding MarR family transcriptional regulator